MSSFTDLHHIRIYKSQIKGIFRILIVFGGDIMLIDSLIEGLSGLRISHDKQIIYIWIHFILINLCLSLIIWNGKSMNFSILIERIFLTNLIERSWISMELSVRNSMIF